MTEAGPWHARMLQMGEDHMSALKKEFMAESGSSSADAIVHHPHARLVIIQKLLAAL